MAWSDATRPVNPRNLVARRIIVGEGDEHSWDHPSGQASEGPSPSCNLKLTHYPE